MLPNLDPKEELADVNLDGDDESDEKDSSDEEAPRRGMPATRSAIIGISAPALKEATSDFDKFRQSYEVFDNLIPHLRYKLMIFRL